jgi:hypothetical protein
MLFGVGYILRGSLKPLTELIGKNPIIEDSTAMLVFLYINGIV